MKDSIVLDNVLKFDQNFVAAELISSLKITFQKLFCPSGRL